MFLSKSVSFILLITAFVATLAAQTIPPPRLFVDTLAKFPGSLVDLTYLPSGELLGVKKQGTINIWSGITKRLSTKPFLDITARVWSGPSEMGLLGAALHPKYPLIPWVFVNYTSTEGTDTFTVVSKFRQSTVDTLTLDATSEVRLLRISQPYENHNGGCIKFGPDGFLYIAMGDGGAGGDPRNYSQNKKSFLGKLLCIDVDNESSGKKYGIPPTNPFVQDATFLPEIYAWGLRNPWRFSFDSETGDLWIGDVGQEAWEEINFTKRSQSGMNFGWRCYEGHRNYNASGCAGRSTMTFPTYVYPRTDSNCSVTGGFVCRGSQSKSLYGKYVFADFCIGRFFVLNPQLDTSRRIAYSKVRNGTRILARNPSTFGETLDGDLIVGDYFSGYVFALRDSNCTPKALIDSPDTVVFCKDNPAKILSKAHAGLTLQWLQNGVAIDEATARQLQVSSAGRYSVAVTNALGCKDTSRTIFAVECLPNAVNQELDTPILSPTPVKDILTFSTSRFRSEEVRWQISDISGKSVLSGIISRTESQVNHSIPINLPNGFYFFSLKDEARNYPSSSFVVFR